MPPALFLAHDPDARRHGLDLVRRDAKLEQELLALGVVFAQQEEGEGVGVGLVLEDRRQLGGDLPPQAVLPALVREVVEEHRRGRGRGLEEKVLGGALAERDPLGGSLDAGVDDEVVHPPDPEVPDAAGALLELVARGVEGLRAEAVVHHYREELRDPVAEHAPDFVGDVPAVVVPPAREPQAKGLDAELGRHGLLIPG